ncbi:MAG TPA: CsgG/HfaB family protein [Candidatus Latescibacteria bacterium]|nr:CsgG/HfaB family protein [Candidatus Latescibacterota bacterium]
MGWMFAVLTAAFLVSGGVLHAGEGNDLGLVRTLPAPETGQDAHVGEVLGIGISADGTAAVSVGFSPRGKVDVIHWSYRDGFLLRRTVLDAGRAARLRTVCATPDAEFAISAGADNVLRIWRVGEKRLERALPIQWEDGHSGAINAVTTSRDGQFVASGSSDRAVKVWNLRTGALLKTLIGHSKAVVCLAISPDGQFIFTGSEDKTVRVWRLSDGQLLRTMEGHSKSVLAVAVTEDGGTVVSGGADGLVNVWRIADGGLLRSLQGQGVAVTSVAVDRGANIVVSGGENGSVVQWRLSDGSVIRGLGYHNGGVTSLAIAPDGFQVISGGGDGRLRVWRLHVQTSEVVAETPAPSVDTSVAVLMTELECPGMDSLRAGTLTEKLRVELDQAGGFRVMERDRLDAIMAEQGRWLSGCFTNTCASNIGDLAGADYVIVGRVAQIEDMYSVTLRIVETATSETVASAAIECSPCDFSAVMRESMRAAAVALRDDFQRRLRSRQ